MKTSIRNILSRPDCAYMIPKLTAALQRDGIMVSNKTPVEIAYLATHDMDAALLALRTIKGHEPKIRKFALFCARQVERQLTDSRSIAALEAIDLYLYGVISRKNLSTAWAEARRAVGDYEEKHRQEYNAATIAAATDTTLSVSDRSRRLNYLRVGYAKTAVAGYDAATAVAAAAATWDMPENPLDLRHSSCWAYARSARATANAAARAISRDAGDSSSPESFAAAAAAYDAARGAQRDCLIAICNAAD